MHRGIIESPGLNSSGHDANGLALRNNRGDRQAATTDEMEKGSSE